jgi:hypothetical protein
MDWDDVHDFDTQEAGRTEREIQDLTFEYRSGIPEELDELY